MALCPYCNSEIDEIILRDGGECPSCHEDILGGIFADQSEESSAKYKNISDIDNVDIHSMNLKDSLFDVQDTSDVEIPKYENRSLSDDNHSNDIDLLSSEIEILSPPTRPKEETIQNTISNGELGSNNNEEDLDIQLGNTSTNANIDASTHALSDTGFLEEEEETEITNSGLYPKAFHTDNEDTSSNKHEVSEDVSPAIKSTVTHKKSTSLPPKAVIPNDVSGAEKSMRSILLQSSGVERDVINSLKDHPFIDEEYIPVQEDLFDHEEISIIENFAFEDVSEVQDIRKLYGVDESILFPPEQTHEIGLLSGNNSKMEHHSTNEKQEVLSQRNTVSQSNSTSRFHKSKSATMTQEDDDLILDEDMINENNEIDNSEENQVSASPEDTCNSSHTIETKHTKINISKHTNSDMSDAKKQEISKQEDSSKIPDWIEDDWGDNFLDEELTEVTELDSNSENVNIAEVIRPDFQASSTQKHKKDETSNSMDASTASSKRNKHQQPRALTTSTIILYILCFLLIVCISFLGFHLLGSQ